MRKFTFISMLSAALLISCNSGEKAENTEKLTYDLIGNSGETIGTVSLSETSDGVRINVSATGIAEGSHGIHFHHTGSCITPDFKSAGSHINPMGKAHGLNNPDGPDNADMPNAVADSSDTVDYNYVNMRVSLNGKPHRPALLDENGSALVMHRNPDDGVTQPIGGAGPRIACAKILKR